MFFSKLLPREGNFFELFNQHAAYIMEAARAFEQLVQHYDDPVQREKYNHLVGRAEHDADGITHQTNRLLHTTFITPIDREQIHSLIDVMDDVADLFEDAADTLIIYDVRKLSTEIVNLTDLAVECCVLVQRAVNLLPKVGVPKVAEEALALCEKIADVESRADRVLRAAMGKLFRHEPDVRELIKLRAIYDLLESITDRCEDVANQIEGVVLENF